MARDDAKRAGVESAGGLTKPADLSEDLGADDARSEPLDGAEDGEEQTSWARSSEPRRISGLRSAGIERNITVARIATNTNGSP